MSCKLRSGRPCGKESSGALPLVRAERVVIDLPPTSIYLASWGKQATRLTTQYANRISNASKKSISTLLAQYYGRFLNQADGLHGKSMVISGARACGLNRMAVCRTRHALQQYARCGNYFFFFAYKQLPTAQPITPYKSSKVRPPHTHISLQCGTTAVYNILAAGGQPQNNCWPCILYRTSSSALIIDFVCSVDLIESNGAFSLIMCCRIRTILLL